MRHKLLIGTLLLAAGVMNGENTAGITRVFDFLPAPGQFVNATIPQYNAGDTRDDMIAKVQDRLSRNQQVHLGAFGGYVIFAFDHPVVNVAGEYDFKINGNAFANNSEPGIVMVGIDSDGDGVPSAGDTWYQLAGSDYEREFKNYQVTYLKGDDTAGTGYAWTSNDPDDPSGMVERNNFHTQSYWPGWITETSLTFTGNRLPKNGTQATNGNWQLPAFGWGYVDNLPNADDNGYNLDWAVDANGQHVDIDHADFIKVYTAMQQCLPNIGETSTEISGAEDLHPNAELPEPPAPVGNFVNGMFILNEAQYGQAPASLIFIDENGDWTFNAYKKANDGLTLGETGASVAIYGDKLYAVSKQAGYQQGGRLNIADAASLVAEGRIESFTSTADMVADAHQFLGIDETKGYLSTTNGVAVIALADNIFTGMIEGTESGYADNETVTDDFYTPYNGQTYCGQVGSMLRWGDYVVAVHQRYGIQVIDTRSDEIVNTITGFFGDVIMAKDGSIWASNANDGAWSWAASPQVASLTHIIDPLTGSTEVISIPDDVAPPAVTWSAWNANRLMVNNDENRIYWREADGYMASLGFVFVPSQKVYYYDIDDDNFGTFIDLTADNNTKQYTIYGSATAFNLKNGHFFAAVNDNVDGNGYVTTNYHLLEFDTDGSLVDDIEYPEEEMWFSTHIVFTDDEAPVCSLTDVALGKGRTKSYRLTDIVSDPDNLTTSIIVTIDEEASGTPMRIGGEPAVLAEISDGMLTLTREADGDEVVNLKINSNGKVVNHEISVTNDIATGVNDLTTAANIVGVKYVNIAGVTSDKPFDGMNIVVTTYDDGTQKIVKQVK